MHWITLLLVTELQGMYRVYVNKHIWGAVLFENKLEQLERLRSEDTPAASRHDYS